LAYVRTWGIANGKAEITRLSTYPDPDCGGKDSARCGWITARAISAAGTPGSSVNRRKPTP
jgi:hypothetical protein